MREAEVLSKFPYLWLCLPDLSVWLLLHLLPWRLVLLVIADYLINLLLVFSDVILVFVVLIFKLILFILVILVLALLIFLLLIRVPGVGLIRVDLYD